jgi:hypothetical protein
MKSFSSVYAAEVGERRPAKNISKPSFAYRAMKFFSSVYAAEIVAPSNA